MYIYIYIYIRIYVDDEPYLLVDRGSLRGGSLTIPTKSAARMREARKNSRGENHGALSGKVRSDRQEATSFVM